MGHPSTEVMKIFAKHLDFSVNENNDTCDTCFRAKKTGKKFYVSENKAEKLFEVIHCDIWGPYRVLSSYGAHYFLTLVDDSSRGVWLYLIKEKSEIKSLLKGFVARFKPSSTKKSKW